MNLWFATSSEPIHPLNKQQIKIFFDSLREIKRTKTTKNNQNQSIKTMTSISVFNPLKHIRYQLAEGILKPDDQNKILWTDIKQKKIFEYNFDTHQYFENQLPDGLKYFNNPSALFETADPNQYLVASGTSIQLWERTTNRILDQIIHPELDPTIQRFNDGKLDSNGKLFIGTLDLYDRPNRSALYRLDIIENPKNPQTPLQDATFTKVIDNISLSNGLGWSLSGTKFYHIDTPQRELQIYHYDQKNGAIWSPPEETIDLTKYQGVPDGLTVHPQTGHIFIAMWNGSQILEIDPKPPIDDDSVIKLYQLENAKYPTNLTFLTSNQALITTANPDNNTNTNDGKIHELNL
jgi:sugar lactone lactonase YvrE